jgi:hypothetical protein
MAELPKDDAFGELGLLFCIIISVINFIHCPTKPDVLWEGAESG